MRSKMIVVPLVVSSIVLGIFNVGAEKDFGRLGIKTLGFYVLTGLLAVVVGLMMVNLLRQETLTLRFMPK